MYSIRYHPYLFFNHDKSTLTFVGFTVTNNDIIDPVTNKIVQKDAISKEFFTLLKENGVNFDENYCNLEKSDLINKLGMVMGIENPQDPDKSYVLTADNVIKMFAILMKFRLVSQSCRYNFFIIIIIIQGVIFLLSLWVRLVVERHV